MRAHLRIDPTTSDAPLNAQSWILVPTFLDHLLRCGSTRFGEPEKLPVEPPDPLLFGSRFARVLGGGGAAGRAPVRFELVSTPDASQ